VSGQSRTDDQSPQRTAENAGEGDRPRAELTHHVYSLTSQHLRTRTTRGRTGGDVPRRQDVRAIEPSPSRLRHIEELVGHQLREAGGPKWPPAWRGGRGSRRPDDGSGARTPEPRQLRAHEVAEDALVRLTGRP